MAIAGNATPAFDVWIENGALQCHKTTVLAALCDQVDPALEGLPNGKDTLVRGSDMHKLRTAWMTGAQIPAHGEKRILRANKEFNFVMKKGFIDNVYETSTSPKKAEPEPEFNEPDSEELLDDDQDEKFE